MKWDAILTKQYLRQKLLVEEVPIRRLSVDLNVSTITILKYAKRTGVYSELKEKGVGHRTKNIDGHKYGKLIVEEQGPNDKWGKTRWYCRCKCGKRKLINTASLIRGLTESCGWCERVNFVGYGEISGAWWRKVKRRAEAHRYEFRITPKYIWNLFLKQDRKCALTGIPLVFIRNADKGVIQTASVDRIDSTKGYVKGNMQIIHKRLNRIKSVLNNEEFIMWCKLVYEHNKLLARSVHIDVSNIGWNDR